MTLVQRLNTHRVSRGLSEYRLRILFGVLLGGAARIAKEYSLDQEALEAECKKIVARLAVIKPKLVDEIEAAFAKALCPHDGYRVCSKCGHDKGAAYELRGRGV